MCVLEGIAPKLESPRFHVQGDIAEKAMPPQPSDKARHPLIEKQKIDKADVWAFLEPVDFSDQHKKFFIYSFSSATLACEI